MYDDSVYIRQDYKEDDSAYIRKNYIKRLCLHFSRLCNMVVSISDWAMGYDSVFIRLDYVKC